MRFATRHDKAKRDIAKMFLNASFYPRGRPDARPQGARAKLPESLKSATGQDLSKALEEHHPALAPLFGTGIGFHLLGLEGEITLATLSLAEEAGLSVLPVHDCCLCPLPEAKAVKAIMEEAYRRVAKRGDCPVVVT